MIISHQHKFIYFKSCKTAGTSIEVFLSAYCGPVDTITRIGEKTADWHKARNHKGFRNHNSVSDVYHKINRSVFNSYYKFTSIRHPVDKMLSLYHWWKKGKGGGGIAGGIDFNTWIRNYNFNQIEAVFHKPFYKLNDKIAIDDFIRYESLTGELERICSIFGMEYDSKYLLHYKKIERNKISINQATRDRIARKFKQELIDLNYDIDAYQL